MGFNTNINNQTLNVFTAFYKIETHVRGEMMPRLRHIQSYINANGMSLMGKVYPNFLKWFVSSMRRHCQP